MAVYSLVWSGILEYEFTVNDGRKRKKLNEILEAFASFLRVGTDREGR